MPVPSHMGKAAAADDILQLIVTAEAITGKVPGESFQEFFRMVSAPAGLIIIQTDRRQPVISGAIQPHIELELYCFPFLLQYLARCFICMNDVPLQQILVKLLIHRLHVFYVAFDDPIRQGCTGKLHSQLFPASWR